LWRSSAATRASPSKNRFLSAIAKIREQIHGDVDLKNYLRTEEALCKLHMVLGNIDHDSVELPPEIGQISANLAESLSLMTELSTWIKGFPEPAITLDTNMMSKCAGVIKIITFLEVLASAPDQQPQLAATAVANVRALKPTPSQILETEWVVSKIADLSKGQHIPKAKSKAKAKAKAAAKLSKPEDCLFVKQPA